MIAHPRILGIETSCDETAAAVVVDGRQVVSNVVASQDELHARYAGVVPEIASRAHLERIVPVVREALAAAGCTYQDLSAVAVGHRPGLIGSLLVGVSAAKAAAWSLGLPVLGVDHVAAHLYAGLLDADAPSYPALGLVVSGGHTSLFVVEDPLSMTLIGRTIDDAVGEAYDKAATMLGLGYPGGPRLDALARDGDDRRFDLPVSMLGKESLDFSFSGLKTALLYAIGGCPRRGESGPSVAHAADGLSEADKADYAASFQRAAVTAVIRKLRRALERHPVATLLVGGGVSCNSRLRGELEDLAQGQGLDLRLPPPKYCLDNAAMIAGLAAHRFAAGRFDDWSLSAHPASALHEV